MVPSGSELPTVRGKRKGDTGGVGERVLHTHPRAHARPTCLQRHIRANTRAPANTHRDPDTSIQKHACANTCPPLPLLPLFKNRKNQLLRLEDSPPGGLLASGPTLPSHLPKWRAPGRKGAQCETGKVFALSWPDYRGHPGPGRPAQPFPLPLPVCFPVCRAISGQAVSRTWCPLGLNYLAGPWPLKWLQRPSGGYFSLTCHHLFSWAPGLWPGIFN